MLFHFTSLLASAALASATFVPDSNSTDKVNSTISFYTDGVLAAVAANPPSSVSHATMTFTNGLRTLPGASFNFTEMAGLTPGNLTVLMIEFAFPSNLTSTNNVFAYHVHESPVTPGDDTCNSAGPHFDPFVANGTQGLVNKTLNSGFSALYNPTPGNLSTFQLGDLAGKWGALTTINGTVPPRTIFENYLRLTGDFSIMGRSVVVHDAPTDTRLACGNITMVAAASSPSGTSPSSASGSGASASASGSSGSSSGVSDSHVPHLLLLAALIPFLYSAI